MSHRQRAWVVAVSAGVVSLLTLPGAAPRNFDPDAMFTGSSLTGWKTIGAATWKAANGEITGTGKGWLVFDKSYQDIALEATWRCTGECQTGILVRAEKTPDGGMKGVYVSLTAGDLVSYHVTLDAQGNETSRERLRPGPTGQVRIAELAEPNQPPFLQPLGERPATAAAPARGAGGAGRGGGAAGGAAAGAAGRGAGGRVGGGGAGRGMPGGIPMPIPQPSNQPKANDWNIAEVILDANILRPLLNSSNGISGGVADDAYGRYGPFAFHVGSGEVKFKDIAYKNIQPRIAFEEKISPKFRMQVLNEYYYCWGPAVADFNHDNIPDIVAGPYYYLGPDYLVAHEIWLAQTINPSTAYFNGLQYAYDFTGDGWPDVINVLFNNPIRLFVNPGTEQRRWDAYVVTDRMTSEQGTLKDVNADGILDFVYKDNDNRLVWANPDPKNPTGIWPKHAISEPGPWPNHGLGAGDVNGDKRPDVIDAFGWWENPGAAGMSDAWTYHPEAFGRWNRSSPGGAEVAVFDINGDGLADIMTSLQAHGWGLAWYEQKKAPDGTISFVEHMVMGDFSTKATNAGGVTFSELHGASFADMDGDGIPDFVTGKRAWSHLDTFIDPDPHGPPVLYVYRTVRNPKAPGGAEFVPELVHNRSGIGSHVSLVDLNKDGETEIITSTKRGTFIFWNNWKKSAAPARR